jgi:hypothetical protein
MATIGKKDGSLKVILHPSTGDSAVYHRPFYTSWEKKKKTVFSTVGMFLSLDCFLKEKRK